MGGDDAPATPQAALALLGDDAPLAVGPAELVGADGLVAGSHVDMGEDPAYAVHEKRDASIRVAMRAVADGLACAVVSAGPTGATVAAAVLELGREDGVRRPVVAARIPTTGEGHVLLLDVGAAPDVDAAGLVAHARLGVAHVRRTGTALPRVGLVNVGEEPGRGSQRVRQAHGLLSDAVDGFVGNVEPAGLLAGAVDVAVTDGFTGNLLLKTLEAAAPRPDADTAALLLGVRGTVLVAHGAASAEQLADAVRWAATLGATASGPVVGDM